MTVTPPTGEVIVKDDSSELESEFAVSNDQKNTGQGGNISAAAGVVFAGFIAWKATKTFVKKAGDFLNSLSEKKTGNGSN